MRSPAALLIACCVVSSGTNVALGQISYPMLMDTAPLAVQQGQASEVEIHSRYTMFGAYAVLVSGTGVKGEIVTKMEPATQLAAATPTKPAATPAKPATTQVAATKDPVKGTSGPAAKPSAAAAKPVTPPPATKPAATATPVKQPDLVAIKIRFQVEPHAQLGVRDVRLATPHGVSTLGQLVIVRDPIVRETNPNDTLETATVVKLPATICGAVEKNEDVDFYKFHVAAGQAITFHVRSARCEDRIHDMQIHVDPIITLRNASGTVLAMSDNYFFADPLLHYKFAAEGDYYLEMRDVRYQGNVYWQYAIEASDRPFVTNVMPLAVAAGKPVELELIGYNLPAKRTVKVTPSAELTEGLEWLELPPSLGANPAPVVVSKLPLVADAGTNLEPDKPQPIDIPSGINGRIAKPGERHYYQVAAKKGDAFTLEVVGRRHQSAIDPLLAILNDKGARQIENDDLAEGRVTYGDARIENWIAPADGKYLVELRDLALDGGPEFVYFLKATRSEPTLLLELDYDKLIVPPGGAAALFVRAFRRAGLAGEVKLRVEGLPAGVKATCGRILDGATDGCIVFEADAKAKPSLANLRVVGEFQVTADGKTRTLDETGRPLEEVYVPGGGRGLVPVDWFTLSVSEPLDIKAVHLKPTTITLKPGESKQIEVKLERAEGFDKNITLDVMNRHLGGIFGNSLPPGVTLDEKASKTLLTGTNSEGVIVLKAAADAKPVDGQVVPIVASAAVNFVMKMSYAGPPLRVSVTKP